MIPTSQNHKIYPRYARLAQVLQQILEKASEQTASLAIHQTGPKQFPASPRKPSVKKLGRYDNPLPTMIVHCRGHIITQTLVKAASVHLEMVKPDEPLSIMLNPYIN